MTFLKKASTFNQKPKVGTVTTSPVIPQKRKSDAVPTQQAEEKFKVLEVRVNELGRDLENGKEIGKKQYYHDLSDDVYTTLSKLPYIDFAILGAKAAKTADAFRAMLPTETPELGGNLFPEDAKNANAEEVANGAASKVADDPSTPAP
uniref:Uncharacterized protein n=1 Tax=Cannabis sativa TaxID=3483 RepID=A0A803P3M5_CANSA